MSTMGPERLLFNTVGQSPVEQDGQALFYAGEPVVLLQKFSYEHDPQRSHWRRHAVQRHFLASLASPLALHDEVFGVAGLVNRYQLFQLTLCELASVRAAQAGAAPDHDLPPTPATGEELLALMALAAPLLQGADASKLATSSPLLLLNLIVALEWTPDAAYRRQLAWTFRRSSDFLYDITDGTIALGQVIIGGTELMDCADIQILASNRLLPRAWMDGMHEARKYTPIRLGCGIWHERTRTLIPWDEPEGYRTIVHELAHHAFNLPDAYLVEQTDANGAGLVVPSIRLDAPTIMANLVGTSELSVDPDGSGANKRSERRMLADKFPELARELVPEAFGGSLSRRDGPGRLPLPFPTVHFAGSLMSIGAAASTLTALPDLTPGAHTSVYLLRPTRDKAGPPYSRVIALGSVDSRSRRAVAEGRGGFELIGAEEHDELLVLDDPLDGQLRVYRSHVSAAGVGLAAVAGQPATALLVDVIPLVPDLDAEPGAYKLLREQLAEPYSQDLEARKLAPPSLKLSDRPEKRLPEAYKTTQPPVPPTLARLRVQVAGGIPQAGWVFPLGGAAPVALAFPTGSALSEPLFVPTLDGQVLLQVGDALHASSFSQGGGPPSHHIGGNSPITAGSSDGNAMLFFRQDPDDQGFYDHIKLVSTTLPGDGGATLAGWRPCSSLVSVAASEALPEQIDPTLILYYSMANLRLPGLAGARVSAFRLDPDGWTAVAGVADPASGFIALRLDGPAGRSLHDTAAALHVERYRLFELVG